LQASLECTHGIGALSLLPAGCQTCIAHAADTMIYLMHRWTIWVVLHVLVTDLLRRDAWASRPQAEGASEELSRRKTMQPDAQAGQPGQPGQPPPDAADDDDNADEEEDEDNDDPSDVKDMADSATGSETTPQAASAAPSNDAPDQTEPAAESQEDLAESGSEDSADELNGNTSGYNFKLGTTLQDLNRRFQAVKKSQDQAIESQLTSLEKAETWPERAVDLHLAWDDLQAAAKARGQPFLDASKETQRRIAEDGASIPQHLEEHLRRPVHSDAAEQEEAPPPE